MTTLRRLLVTAPLVFACTGDGPVDSADFAAPGEPASSGTCVPGGGASAFASCLDSFAPSDPAAFGHDALPDIVLGPPQGSPTGGSHVASLGCGGSVTVYLEPPIHDVAGPDLLVFENAFVTGDATFAEPARVLVSDDGRAWFGFPCDLRGDGEWPPEGCAGIEPVHALDEVPSPPGPDEVGGDAFDLTDIGLTTIRYVRLRDVSREYFGSEIWCTGDAAGFDLDGVGNVGFEW